MAKKKYNEMFEKKCDEQMKIENDIISCVEELFKRYRLYNPDGKYLNISVIDDLNNSSEMYISVSNKYFDDDKDKPVCGFKIIGKDGTSRTVDTMCRKDI